MAKRLIAKNASSAIDQEEFSKEYESLSAKFEEGRSRLDELKREKAGAFVKKTRIESFLSEMRKTRKVIDAWDEDIWLLTMEVVRIHDDGTAEFVFKDGTVISEKIK